MHLCCTIIVGNIIASYAYICCFIIIIIIFKLIRWLVHEPKDIGGQLQWLENTLVEAEKNNEFVHILAHLPAGASECQFTWSRQYNRIINRFAHIIAGQFNGHTHNDEFNVFYDINNPSKPINVAWNGGSITAWAKLNPNYKVYKANSNNYV